MSVPSAAIQPFRGFNINAVIAKKVGKARHVTGDRNMIGDR